MESDAQQIEALVIRWAEAVHAGDIEGVLADHAEDIVMFDVPPPERGVRGLEAYRETWPPFFRWQAHGAVFEVESVEVEAGDTVAYAQALLRCGTSEELEADREKRLRLTLGLRKEEGRWVVAHEHHSFPDESAALLDAERELRELHEDWFRSTASKNLDGLMEPIAEDVVSYEHDEPLQHVGIASVREVCQRALDTAPQSVEWEVPELELAIRGDLAVAWGLNHLRAETAEGTVLESWSRGTRVFRHREGRWLLTHQHLSYPYDPETGEAKTDLEP